jgi:hypothetical protein
MIHCNDNFITYLNQLPDDIQMKITMFFLSYGSVISRAMTAEISKYKYIIEGESAEEAENPQEKTLWRAYIDVPWIEHRHRRKFRLKRTIGKCPPETTEELRLAMIHNVPYMSQLRRRFIFELNALARQRLLECIRCEHTEF